MTLKLLQDLTEALTILPGVGQRTAERMSYYLLQRKAGGIKLANVLIETMTKIKRCQNCRDYSENNLCPICSNPKRHQHQLCVVETPLDIYTIEKTGTYFGLYFNLMGHLSPLDGIGPKDLGIDFLKKILAEKQLEEVILATSTTLEGEATANYLADLIKSYKIKCTRIAQGIPAGGELEFSSLNTIAQAIISRFPY